MTKIIHVVGARPNFMKASPLIEEINNKYSNTVNQILIHTGQHYDPKMSEQFFKDLSLPKPNLNLGIGSGSQSWQTAQIMIEIEKVINKEKPDFVLVYGDVNSTLATALVCAKIGIKVIHVEAGLRSFDYNMPEEINRKITDQISDLLLTPSQDANDNLIKEGINKKKIKLVGNIMIDTLVRIRPIADLLINKLTEKYGIENNYLLTTFHRPSNVDDPIKLNFIIENLKELTKDMSVIFPVHPRTLKNLKLFDISLEGIKVTEPLSYLEFLALESHANLVITDSGGIQEETTFLNIPCLTIRENTERPITILKGTNSLVKTSDNIVESVYKKLSRDRDTHVSKIKYWDGKTAKRICKILFT